MNESRWNNRSSKKTSRATSGKTEVIVRHKNDFQETYAGARSHPKHIKSIFIQNADGERFKYPFIHTAGAFAMAQHVDHGGVPHDPAGRAIIKMSEEIAQLGEFQKKVRSATLHDDATGITERAIGRMNELKAQVAALGKRHHYENWINEFHGGIDDDDMVLDAVTMEQYKQKFTQTSFEESLSDFFPLLHRIMSETNAVDLDNYVGEAFDVPGQSGTMGQSVLQRHPEDQFQEWANAVEGGELTPDQVAELKHAIEELPDGKLQLGPNGQTAIDFFNELVELHPDLGEKFQEQSSINPEADPIEDVLTPWAQEHYPNLVTSLGLGGGEVEPAPEPEPAPPEVGAQPDGEEPGEELPMAENEKNPGYRQIHSGWSVKTGKKHENEYGIPYKLEHERQARDHAEHIGGKVVKVDQNGMPMVDKQGMEENEEMGGPANKTMPTRESIVKEVAKLVKSRFNEDNPEVGPFNGAPNIALDVKKKCSEMFGDEVGEQAEELALQFMEKLTQKWEEKHGPVEDDGLSRLKELLGNVKQKVEDIDRPAGGVATVHGMMSSESGPDKSQIPAANRKEKGGDWKMSTKDVEAEKNKSPTTSKGLDAAKAKMGMSEDIADILKLASYLKSSK
jgi:hypothetical protein